MAEVLKGLPVAKGILDDLLQRVGKLKKKNIAPTFAIIRVGENPSDIAYENQIKKKAGEVGVFVREVSYSEAGALAMDGTASGGSDLAKNGTASGETDLAKTGMASREAALQDKLIEDIKKLNVDRDVHGIMIFRPLPKGIDEKAVCEAISLDKDIDGVSKASLAQVFTDGDKGFPPCTAEACIKTLKHYDIELEGRNVTVYGRSLVIGKPVAMMAMRENANVSIAHSRTRKKDFDELGKRADIIIASIGKANFIDKESLGRDQIILDVGINVSKDGKLTGDVNFDEACKTAKGVSPVPGGIGSVTTAILLEHVVRAAEH